MQIQTLPDDLYSTRKNKSAKSSKGKNALLSISKLMSIGLDLRKIN